MNIDTDLLYDDEESERRRRERKKRREERRKRTTEKRKSLSFLWGVRELSPLIHSALSEAGEVDYQSIAGKVNKQEDVLRNILEKLGCDNSSPEAFHLRAGIAASKLIANTEHVDTDKLYSCIKLLSASNDNKSDLIEQIEIGVFSSDVLVNIKAQMLPSLYGFFTSLQTLTSDNSLIDEYVSWLNKITTRLAKDVSFNWDKKSTYRDRETLFVSMLPICAEISVNSFYDYLSKYNGASRSTELSSSLQVLLPVLHETIQDMDMGYKEHHKKDIDWLYEELHKVITKRIPTILIPKDQNLYYNRIMGAIISDIDSIAADCWRKESTRFIDKVEKELSGLSDSEAEKIMIEKYSDPMPITGFVSGLLSKLDRWPGIINPIDIDLAIVSSMAEKKMAVLWGLTDAICQIRSKK